MNNKVYLALIGVLIIVVGFLGYKLSQEQDTVAERDTTIENQELEYDKLSIELERMLISYDTLETANEDLVAQLGASREEVQFLLDKVQNKDWSIHQLKKETETLRQIMKGYVVTIDSLNTLAQNLAAERDLLEGDLAAEKDRSSALQENLDSAEDILEKGSVLTTGDILAEGIRLRASGKQAETSRASKTDMLKTCFMVRKNNIAKPGNKNLYLRIMGPDGKVLESKDENAQSEFDGQTQAYSVKRTIDYSNEEIKVCIFYSIKDELKSGDYKVHIYQESDLIGTTDLSLK
jgi:peptidoglycan hydrolase CwlO-like protein